MEWCITPSNVEAMREVATPTIAVFSGLGAFIGVCVFFLLVWAHRRWTDEGQAEMRADIWEATALDERAARVLLEKELRYSQERTLQLYNLCVSAGLANEASKMPGEESIHDD